MQQSRLDRLVTLLETGSTNLIRNTAAQQLADLQKHHPEDLYSLLSRVIPFLRSDRWDTRLAAAKAIGGIVANTALFDPNEDDDGVLSIENGKAEDVAKTEGDGADAIKAELKAEEQDEDLDLIDAKEFKSSQIGELLKLATLDIGAVITNGKKLLGSGGREEDYALAGYDASARLAIQRQSLPARLGLLGKYIEPEITIDPLSSRPSAIMPILTKNGSNGLLDNGGPDSPHRPISRQDSVDDGGLSKRQLNQLKRKSKMDARNQAKKVRLVDLGPQRRDSQDTYSPGPTPTPRKAEENSKMDIFYSENGVEEDDGKLVTEFKGEQTPEAPIYQAEIEEESSSEWPFEKLCDILALDLFDSNWTIRHGASIALREIIQHHGHGAGRHRGKTRTENDQLNAAWLDDLACRYCCVMMLDKFGDYVSDNVVAPIRESVGQALGTLLIHLPKDKLHGIYNVLYRMVMQEDIGIEFRIWEVCHGGMLGLRYLGAVRKDILITHLDGIVKAVTKGLTDADDDVRAVAAATLTPIAEDLVNLRRALLPSLLSIVWDCLSDLSDDLSASTGFVMDLLAKLCSFETVLQIMLNNTGAETDAFEYSFQSLVPRLYPFLRHTIPSVRAAVLRAFLTFLKFEVPEGKAWVDGKILRLVFQNLVVERVDEVLDLSASVWNALCSWLSSQKKLHQEFMPHAQALLTLTLHPIGVSRCPLPVDYYLIMKPSGQYLVDPPPSMRSPNEQPAKRRRRSEKRDEPVNLSRGHHIDVPMLQGDIDLVGYETLIRARLYSARAFGLAFALAQQEGQVDEIQAGLLRGISSPYASTQMHAACVARETTISSGTLSPENIAGLKAMVEDDRPPAYTDLLQYLQIARSQTSSLLTTFIEHARIQPSRVPVIPVVVQGEPGAGPSAFSLAIAEKVCESDYERLVSSLTATQRIMASEILVGARANLRIAIDEASKMKLERDVRVRAAASAALVALEDIPKKPGKLIKGLMDSIKAEEIFMVQKRSAEAVTSLIGLYASGKAGSRGPADKVIGNLIKFYCIDTSETPEFAPNKHLKDDILSLRKEEDHKDYAEQAAYEAEAKAARITRRGTKETLDRLALTFGKELFVIAPTLRSKISGPIQTLFATEETKDSLPSMSDDQGQDVVDAFSVLRALIPNLATELHPFIDEMLTYLLRALKCDLSVYRYSAAKCFATICATLTVKGMTRLVEEVIPSISNPKFVRYRQGAIETIYHLIHTMEDRILPYVVFLIVPILGRMSDSNQDVRLIATTTFATLVKLVPLEAGIPDPPGFSPELLAGRDRERKFVSQMLDPKKTEKFEIPVAIKATLRSYQQDGVNWLAFLNKFNLHGVLCDDMGLGKTLQTLCIVASDHHNRAEEFAKTKKDEFARLPSLIVCPPTLSGHWVQEIAQYAPFLTCAAYVGNPGDRAKVRGRLSEVDIVITSYEVCRNDIDVFTALDFNYCVLDEGHLIKNAKSKTSQAVKRLRSNHRLILSGTPIQNNVLELWSLFDFLMPGFLGTEKVFADRFAKPIAASRNAKSSSKEQERGALAIESLHKQVLPFLLRRLKEEVLDDLPPKIIQNYYCELSDLQKRLMDDFARKESKTITGLVGNSDKAAKTHIFQALQYMRKLCNSPSLVVKEGHKQYGQITSQLASKGSSLRDIAHAPKLTALRDLLLDCGIGASEPSSEFPASGAAISPHRALIFCQMKEMLDIVISDVLKPLLPSVSYLRLDGGVEASRRQQIVNTFNSDPSFDVLLLTTSVGGLGLNLTGADTVIFVEHDWNPQKDMQAMDRAHRIGQKKVVNVYRLITRGTLEEKILKLQRFKIDVASTVVNQQNAGLATMGTDEILDLFNIEDSVSSEVEHVAAPNAEVSIVGAEDAVDATGELRKKGEKSVLDGLSELWDEGQYKEEYDIGRFLARMQG